MIPILFMITTLHGRIYLDVGTNEGVGTLRDARKLGRLLVRKGFKRDRRARRVRTPREGPQRRVTTSERPLLRYVEETGGRHSESEWAQRLAPALEFLIG